MILLLLSLSFSILARSGDPCLRDIQRLCPDARVSLEKEQCLEKNLEELSQECRLELRRLNQLVKDAGIRGGAFAFSGQSSGLGLIPPQNTVLTAEGFRSFEGRPQTMNQGRASLTSPFWVRDGKSFVTTLSASSIDFSQGVRPPEGRRLRRLGHQELAGQYIQRKGQKIYLLRGAVGSASDRPFFSDRELVYTLSGFYAPKASVESTWAYGVFISNNNSIASYLPIPGIMYIYKKGNFSGMVGVPMMTVQWTPSSKLVLSASYFITNFRLSAAYLVRDATQLGLGFQINQQTFLRSDRDNLQERIFYNEKRVYLGFKQGLSRSLALELQAGTSFDRRLKEGRRFNNTKWERDLGRSIFASSALIVLF